MDHLEYAEDDLFGLDHEAGDDDLFHINQSTPIPVRPNAIAGPSRLATGAREAPSSHPPVASTAQRIEELRIRKQAGKKVENGGIGPSTLKSACLSVIRRNGARIWDIGDTPYELLRSFLDDLPAEQLAEIEEASPGVMKDTDWLWEVFLLQENPIFHERCREKKGEPRTSGWRRMYKKAKEDLEDRQNQAASRVAERYRQLEEEKASKRIVFVDKVIPTKNKGGKRTLGGVTSPGLPGKAGTSALSKARQDATRARMAMTHASGRYIPPPPKSRTAPRDDHAVFKNPYLDPAPSSDHAGRLPPPRTIEQPPRTRSLSAPSHFPGSYPTHTQNEVRAALPDHLRNSSVPETVLKEERFKISSERSKYESVKKADVRNFEIPRSKIERSNLFGGEFRARDSAPKGLLESLSRSQELGMEGKAGGHGSKRKRIGNDTGHEGSKPASSRIAPALSTPAALATISPHPGGGTDVLNDRDQSRQMESVLFRKKKPSRPG